MASTLGLSLVSGITFGMALTSASVYQPTVIINQMRLTDFHMLLAFLSASAASAIAIVAANYSGYARLGHRTDSSYGWFIRHDANIIGGALLGAGMSLTGACPGTVLVQLGVDQSRIAWLTAAGAVLGGIAFVKLAPLLKVNSSNTNATTNGDTEKKQPSYTVMQKTGLSTSTTVFVYEALCLFMILCSTYLPRSQHWLHPVTGGILIGLAQVISIALTKKSLGVSSAYADIGKQFWAAVEAGPVSSVSTSASALALGKSSMPFAAGIAAGAYLAKRLELCHAAFNAAVEKAYNAPGASAAFLWAMDQGKWSFDTLDNPYESTLTRQNYSRSAAESLSDWDKTAVGGHGQPEQMARWLGDKAYYHLFTTDVGAGEHCQLGAEHQLGMVTLDWPADVFNGKTGNNRTTY
ncbi:hypothetical protein DV736_g6410, partial [Chaetothyriales sp. CBS 134916]